MKYSHAPVARERFLTWCLSPKTTDEEALQRALASVPDEHWPFVETRLRVLLVEQKERLLPTPTAFTKPASDYQASNEAAWCALFEKESVCFAEIWTRHRRFSKERYFLK